MHYHSQGMTSCQDRLKTAMGSTSASMGARTRAHRIRSSEIAAPLALQRAPRVGSNPLVRVHCEGITGCAAGWDDSAA